MPYDFNPREEELEPQAGGSRRGGPPRKYTSAAVMDSFPDESPVRQRPLLRRLLDRLRKLKKR
jgi:hypothetical protein